MGKQKNFWNEHKARRMGLTIMAMALLMSCIWIAPVRAWDLDPQLLGNENGVKLRIMAGDVNEGMFGAWGSWDSDIDRERVWGAGLCGQLDISKPVGTVLDTILGTPNEWWDLLDKLGGQLYLGADVGGVDLGGNPKATAVPCVGVKLGPLIAEIGYEFFDSGRVNAETGVIVKDGLTYYIGIQRVFLF
jgi:hypothetical protein